MGGGGGGQPCLPFRRCAKTDDLDHGDGEVLAGAERRIVEGAARLCPPEFQVRIQVDSSPVPGTKNGFKGTVRPDKISLRRMVLPFKGLG
jgi:hypothetical protein